MDDRFRVSGVVQDAGRVGVPGLMLAVVDADDLSADDLLGLGTTGADGRFSLSFLGSEFRQGMLETEETPDLVVTVSCLIDGAYVAVFRRAYGDQDWSTGEVNLGAIVLDGVDLAHPTALEGVEALPGVNRRAVRLDIDQAMVRECLAETAPIVEHLTGWRGLLDGLTVEVADSLAPYMLRESFAAAGTDPESFDAKFAAWFADLAQGPGAGCALYDPHIHAVVIHGGIMEQVGLDGLKVICGHELVHVGQYANTPGLKAYNLDHLRSMRVDAQNADAEAMAARAAYMLELEGYAKYIETDFLRKRFYPLAVLGYHASVVEEMLRATVAWAMPGTEGHRDAKAAQYSDGLAAYRARQRGDVPARFELDVARLPGGAAFVSAASGTS